jgi:hypothetical protein
LKQLYLWIVLSIFCAVFFAPRSSQFTR